MTWVALKSIAERRTRAVLTALAIVLGVAMIAGSFILTDTIDRAFTTIFSSSYTQTDLVVRGKPVVADSMSGAPTVPAHLLPEVRALPGVAAAAGSMVDLTGTGDNAKLIGKDGAVITGDNPTFGFGIDPSQPRFNPLTLAEGSWAAGPDQMVIDIGTAKAHGFAVGDRVGVASDGPVRTFTVTGLARFGGVDSIGGATIAVFDIPTARTVLGKTGFDAIQVATKPGVSQAQVQREIAPLLPAAAEVKTGDEQAQSDKAVISEAITFIRGFLLAFGGIALFVGAFVIFNTLSITVAQRSRELATLRTLGASRRQVLRSVIAEAGIIGFAASVVGLGLGYVLAKGLSAIFRAVGADMPQADTVFETRTVVVSLVVGTVITLLAGVIPAIRATRVPPIAAVREGAVLPQRAHGAPDARVRPRRHRPRGRPAGPRAAGGRARRQRAAAELRRRHAGAVHRRGDDLVPARPADRRRGRLADRAPGRRGRRAGPRERGPQPRPHGVHRGGADDRPRAGHLRLGRRRRPARHHRARPSTRAGLGGLRRDLGERLGARAAGRRPRRWPPAGVGTVVERPSGRRPSSTAPTKRSRRRPGARSRGIYRFDWSEGSDAALATLDGRRDRPKAFAKDHDLAIGDARCHRQPLGRRLHRTVTGVYDPPRIAAAAGRGVDLAEGLRLGLPAPEGHLHPRGRGPGGRRPPASRRSLSGSRTRRSAHAVGASRRTTRPT